jgi:lipid-A-disaccharide synthase
MQFMIIAGEASGDALAAELVAALRQAAAGRAGGSRLPEFFGAGGPQMAKAGVSLAFDLTEHAVIGLWEVIRNYSKFKRLFNVLLQLAWERKPDAIVLVDFSGFNRRFAHAVRQRIRTQLAVAESWNPSIIQYVSPQVWASRPKRAELLARDIELLLAILPFEKKWYAERVPQLRVEFVGHPLVDRAAKDRASAHVPDPAENETLEPLVILLPGSRTGELKRHLPVMIEAARRISSAKKVRFRMVLPNERLAAIAQSQLRSAAPGIDLRIGNPGESLAQAAVAIASTGTVTLECAIFGVPTVALYKTSWLTYQIGRRLVTVDSLAMPNILAGRRVIPELIQSDATAANLAREALDLLNNAERRAVVKTGLAEVTVALGAPGASQRAARAILDLMQTRHPVRGTGRG